MGIVAHSRLFFKERKKPLIPVPLFLPMPPKQYDCFRGYNFTFQFSPNTRQTKNCKTGACNRKVMQSFVCALEGRREQ